MLPRAILFDLDNTLVHREQSLASYAKRFVADFSNHLDDVSHEQVRATIVEQDNGGYLDPASGFKSIKEAVCFGLASKLTWRQQAPREALQAHWAAHNTQHTVEMPGASALMALIGKRNIRIGIISNGGERSRRERVRGLSFHTRIETLISSERVGIQKPDRRIFQLAAKELGLEEGDCWYVGDHPINDVAGAQGAGMRAIWLEGFHDWPATETPPQFSVKTLAGVGKLLETA